MPSRPIATLEGSVIVPLPDLESDGVRRSADACLVLFRCPTARTCGADELAVREERHPAGVDDEPGIRDVVAPVVAAWLRALHEIAAREAPEHGRERLPDREPQGSERHAVHALARDDMAPRVDHCRGE